MSEGKRMFSQIAAIFQQKTICEGARAKEKIWFEKELKTPSVGAKFGLKYEGREKIWYH